MSVKKKKLTLPTIWMTVYGDFITNLTLFFILLFATVLMALQQGLSKEELKKFMNQISGAVQMEHRKARESKLDNAKVTIAAIDGVSAVTLMDRALAITLPEEVLFEAGKAQLNDRAKNVLAKVGRALADDSFGRIVVEGHTCDLPPRQQAPASLARWQLALARSTGLGPYSSNRELSAARALQVVNYFNKEKIISPERLAASAWGAARPLLPNDSEQHRAANRRIEIHVLLAK